MLRGLDLTNLAGFLGLVIWILNPRPSSLPEESRRSEEEFELLHADGSELRDDVVDDASSCKSSSSLMGNSRRWAIRQLLFSSISKSRSIFVEMREKSTILTKLLGTVAMTWSRETNALLWRSSVTTVVRSFQMGPRCFATPFKLQWRRCLPSCFLCAPKTYGVTTWRLRVPNSNFLMGCEKPRGRGDEG